MDQKYIENLGMSSEVDEGLWDRLKSRATGYTQAARNLAGGGTTDIQTAQFRSLFKTFLTNTVKTITDFQKVIQPYKQSGKMDTQTVKDTEKLISLLPILKNMQALPITEANLFTRPFSALGAQASGQPSNILDTYKKLLQKSWKSFIDDAKKLNIVPSDYIIRNISRHYPAAKGFLDKFSDAIRVDINTGRPLNIPAGATPTGKNIDEPESTPAAPATSAAPQQTPDMSKWTIRPANVDAPEIETEPKQKPGQVVGAPAAPETPAFKFNLPANPRSIEEPSEPSTSSSTGSEPVKPTAAPAEPPAATPGVSHQLGVDPTAPNFPAILTKALSLKAIDKIIRDITPDQIHEILKEVDEPSPDDKEDASLKMAKLIRKYIKRDATQAKYPFPKENPVEIKIGSRGIQWKLRYRYAKEIAGHSIDCAQDVMSVNPKTGVETVDTKGKWQPFITFNARDVVTSDYQVNTSLDPLAIISRTNPALGQKIKEAGGSFTDSKKNAELAGSLDTIIRAGSEELSRGQRQLSDKPTGSDKPEQERPTSGPGIATGEPPDPLKPAVSATTPPPELQGKIGKIAPTGELPPEEQPKSGKKLPPQYQGLKPKMAADELRKIIDAAGTSAAGKKESPLRTIALKAAMNAVSEGGRHKKNLRQLETDAKQAAKDAVDAFKKEEPKKAPKKPTSVKAPAPKKAPKKAAPENPTIAPSVAPVTSKPVESPVVATPEPPVEEPTITSPTKPKFDYDVLRKKPINQMTPEEAAFVRQVAASRDRVMRKVQEDFTLSFKDFYPL